jgi:hypothetical protein
VTGAVLAALRAAALDAPDVRRPLDHLQGDASLAIDHIDFPRLAGRTSKNMRGAPDGFDELMPFSADRKEEWNAAFRGGWYCGQQRLPRRRGIPRRRVGASQAWSSRTCLS